MSLLDRVSSTARADICTVYSIVYDRYRNRCASGSMDNTVKVWDVLTGECLHTLAGHTSLVGLLGNSPNYLVSAAADASLRVWDSNTHELKHTFSSHGGAITCFQHDETKVVSGSEGSLKLWDIRTGAYIRDLISGNFSVWQVAFNGNMLVAASNRNSNTVFDVFDFGPMNHCSGVDDETLDARARPAWERLNPREPQTYQVDDLDGVELTSPRDFTAAAFDRSPSASHNRDSRLLGLKSRRSSRLANRSVGNVKVGTYHPPRSARASSSRYNGSPSPAGPGPGTSTMSQLGHASGSRSRPAQLVIQESFAPIFDEDRADEPMDEDFQEAPF